MFYNLLYLVPKNWLSRVVGHLVERRWPFGLHRVIRDAMIRAFRPVVEEAEHPLAHYATWAEFFTRRLAPGARPVGAGPLVCPVDGTLTQRGRLGGAGEELVQVKGVRYALSGLFPGWDPAPYRGGAFLTVYLAPWNYHRIHAPADCNVLRVRHEPGALWPVNAWSVRSIRGLFVRNDRVNVEMEAPLAEGPMRMALSLVGATNVGRTTLAFSGLSGNAPGIHAAREEAFVPPVHLDKAAELACFEMGSTIVLVLDAAGAARLRPGLLDSTEPVAVRMGEDLAAA